MAKHYLLSRALDPLLGVFTGLLAYHLHETNPRSAPAPGHTLRELAVWHWAVRGDARRVREADAEREAGGEWDSVRRELEAEHAK
ncbi:hypothetical protein Q5752_003917 [Cryptotrichosporon argae]